MSCPVCNDVGMVKTMDLENGGWETCPHCHPPVPREPGLLARLWRRLQARFRWNLTAVCELSKGRGPHNDYHDYPDDIHGQPWHFMPLKCKRCGKEFYI